MKRAVVVCLALALHCGMARAQAQPPADQEKAQPGEPAPEGVPSPDAERERQRPPADQARNYARAPGREPEDVALFVPRLVLAVPRYVLKLVFFPVKKTIEFLDRHAVIEEVVDILYNDERTGGIVPKLSIDSYFGPSLGVKAFHEDLAGHHEYGSAEVKFGGVYNLATQLHFRAIQFGGTRLWLESVARFEIEPALLFQGIGHPEVREGGSGLGVREAAVATRFEQQRLLNLFRAGYSFGQPTSLVQIGATGLFNVRDFGPKQKGNEPSIEQVYDTSELAGFDRRVSVFEADLNLVVDTRNYAGATSSGTYLEVFAGKVPRLASYAFWHHGLEVTQYLNLYRHSRVLVLRAVVEGVEGSESDIPFSELPRLGGPNRLRGYPLDRFRDEKAAVGTIEYRYPIHQFVAGSLYLDVGRVARSYSDFLDSKWKAGVGGGFLIRSQTKQLFTFDIAYGEGIQFHLTTDPLRAFANRDTEL